MPDSNRPVETELKLAVSPAAEKSLSQFAPFRSSTAGKPKSQRILTTYFDTPKYDLNRLGLSLRVRRVGQKRLQTVKTTGDPSAAKVRGEWEWPVAEDAPNLELARQASIEPAIPQGIDDSLAPIVTTDVVRTTRVVQVEGGTVEVALDTGSIAAGEARAPIHELELELQEGAPSAVFRMALALHAATPVAIEAESKVSRGLRLRQNAGPSAREASPPELDPEASAAEAFSVIAMNALGHLVANREAASARLAEGIHQTRVAIRRVRTALGLFEPWLEPHAANLFQGELQRLGRVIGEARDWDVFCDEMVGKSFSPEDADWARLLNDAAAEPRAKADRASAGEVDSAAFTALALGLSAWAQSGRERRELLGDKRLERPIADVAPALLGRLALKVEKRGRALGPDATPEELHPLRKALKKLRYGVEFFGPVYRPKAVKRVVRSLKRLQKSLGVINDAAVAVRLAESLAQNGHMELGPPAAAMAHNRDRAREKAQRKLPKQWRAFEKVDPLWT